MKMAMSMFGRGAKGAAGMAVKSMQISSKATGFKASYKMADTQKINLLPPGYWLTKIKSSVTNLKVL